MFISPLFNHSFPSQDLNFTIFRFLFAVHDSDPDAGNPPEAEAFCEDEAFYALKADASWYVRSPGYLLAFQVRDEGKRWCPSLLLVSWGLMRI